MVGIGATQQHNWDGALAAVATEMTAAPADVGLLAVQKAQRLFDAA
jgi:hypothetical protein